MNTVHNIFRLGVKEFWSILRDPIMIVLIVFAFTVSVYVSARALPDTLHKAPISVVDEDDSPISIRLITALQPPYFLKPTRVTLSEMDSRMDAGLDTFSIDIPPNFQRDLLDGRSPTIQLNVDATRMSQAFNGTRYVQMIINQEIETFMRGKRLEVGSLIELNDRMRYNAELENSWFGGVARLIDQVTMLSIILTGAALLRERERGTIEHLLVMPVTPFEIMTSKVWSMAVIVLLATGFSLFVVVKGWLEIPTQGALWLFFLGTVLQLFATTSLGIFMGTLARSMPQFGLLMVIVLLPLQMLSGSSTPRESMPKWVQDVMLAAPNTHYVSLSQGVLFRGAGLDVVWPELLALIGLGTLFFVITLSRFRRTIGLLA